MFVCHWLCQCREQACFSQTQHWQSQWHTARAVTTHSLRQTVVIPFGASDHFSLPLDGHHGVQPIFQKSQFCGHAGKIVHQAAHRTGLCRLRRLAGLCGCAMDGAFDMAPVRRQMVLPTIRTEEMDRVQVIRLSRQLFVVYRSFAGRLYGPGHGR